MKQLTSPEFRKSYPRLTEPVEVTALGRVIGTFYPGPSRTPSDAALAALSEPFDPREAIAARSGVSQAERDRILRRINKSS